MDLCEHGDIRAACLDCLTAAPPERPNPPAPTRDGGTWPAEFPGHCSGCNLPISETQPICRMTDGTYRHDGCDQ